MQTFTGNVSDAGAAGEPLFMAGTVTVDNVGAGEFGEHNFLGYARSDRRGGSGCAESGSCRGALNFRSSCAGAAHPPAERRDAEKGKAQQRRDALSPDRCAQRIVAAEGGHDREIRGARERNREREHAAQRARVDRDRVARGLVAAVGQDVHELERFGAPEAERRLQPPEREEHRRAAQDARSHERQR